MAVPEFKRLEIHDQHVIEEFVGNFEPYSDFNFISLLTYDTQETTEFTLHNNCLLVKFEDYDTNENFYSLLGTENVYQNIVELIDLSKMNGLEPTLHLIPEQAINSLSENEAQHLKIEEDRDNFDYIVSAKDVAELTLEEFPRKRHLIDKFIANYPHVTSRLIDLSTEENQRAIMDTFALWRDINNKSEDDTSTELIAVQRLLAHNQALPSAYALGLYDNGELIAFNTFDITTNNYGVSSFQKADKKYEGIYAFLTTCAAQEMVKLGVELINYEQDLGIEGLRSSKLSWHPVKYLKKYSVSLSS